MNKYGMYLQNGDDLIHLTHQENIERALEFFANIKKMPIKNFNKITNKNYMKSPKKCTQYN